MIKCYLCNSTSFKTRKGVVRDVPDLEILECAGCGLVTLSSLEHIQAGFYEKSGMHGEALVPIDIWLKETDGDDQRRFEMLKVALANKKVLDFGCGAGGFLVKAQALAAHVAGIELEQRVQTHWAGRLAIHPDFASAGGGGVRLNHSISCGRAPARSKKNPPIPCPTNRKKRADDYRSTQLGRCTTHSF